MNLVGCLNTQFSVVYVTFSMSVVVTHASQGSQLPTRYLRMLNIRQFCLVNHVPLVPVALYTNINYSNNLHVKLFSCLIISAFG